MTDLADDGEILNLEVLPNDEAILGVRLTGSIADATIVAISTDDGTVTQLVEGISPRYADSGHLVYVRADGALMAAPFDQASLATTGPAVPLGPAVAILTSGEAAFSIATNGSLLYRSVGARGSRMVRLGRDGRETPLDADMIASFGRLALSPDGNQLAFTTGVAGQSLSTSELNQGGRRLAVKALPEGPLTVLASLTASGSTYPSWDSSGQWVYFRYGPDLWRVRSDGSLPPERVFGFERPIAEGQVIDDGTLILRTFPTGFDRDIMLVAPGDSIPREFMSSDFDQSGPVLSPDGRWLAYTSGENGRNEIFVRPFPSGDGLYPVSSDGGQIPKWAHTGRELFFLSDDGDLMSVDVRVEWTIQFTPPTVLSSRTRDFGRDYDVFPDDQSFLFLEPTGDDATMVLVLNFFEELGRLAPTR